MFKRRTTMNDQNDNPKEQPTPQPEPQTRGEESPDALRARLAEAEDRYKRTLADFSNYQRRSLQNEREARERGVEAVVESVITALDHLEKALSHDVSSMSAEQVAQGLRLIRDELVKAVVRHGAGLIEPKPDEEFDPMRHQAVARRPASGVRGGHVVQLLQTGYTLGERTIRPAMVIVAPAEETQDPIEGDEG